MSAAARAITEAMRVKFDESPSIKRKMDDVAEAGLTVDFVVSSRVAQSPHLKLRNRGLQVQVLPGVLVLPPARRSRDPAYRQPLGTRGTSTGFGCTSSMMPSKDRGMIAPVASFAGSGPSSRTILVISGFITGAPLGPGLASCCRVPTQTMLDSRSWNSQACQPP